MSQNTINSNYYDISLPVPLQQSFTYKSTSSLVPGIRVLVPFGRRQLVGVVLGQRNQPPADFPEDKIKEIQLVIDLAPFFTPHLLDLARWLSEYYAHPLGEVLKTMMPAEAYKNKKEYAQLTDRGASELRGDYSQLNDEIPVLGRGALLKALFNQRSKLSLVQLRKKWSQLVLIHPDWAAWDLKALEKLRLISISKDLIPKTRSSITQSKQTSSQERRETAGESAVSDAQVRIPLASIKRNEVTTKNLQQLTPKQLLIFSQITEHFCEFRAHNRFKPILLQGITGSGKTEIYVHLIDYLFRTCQQDKSPAQALLLLPEIALTPQMTRIFTDRFGPLVAVVHSGLLDSERARELNRIRHGEARILIGPRSALFAPFLNLGLIIVDEEHDTSYKQSTGLTYHGRDFAVMRGKKEGALVLLGSATPSLESYYNAQSGRYHWLILDERVHTRPLPQIISLQSPLPKSTKELLIAQSDGNFKKTKPWEMPLHPEILSTMQKTLELGQQIMVIVSRRGYASFLYDVEAGHPVRCPNCSISLTLHKNAEHLYCHYCGLRNHIQNLLKEHPGKAFLAIGYGSQKIESILKDTFPHVKISRIDSDLTVQKNFLEKELAAFRAAETQILVGTQLIAKGHDFPGVTLVVILDVDQLLDLPDFRAGERTFQLIVQAAGRAGRAERKGLVLLQTLRGKNPVLNYAAHQDFEAFAHAELKLRQALGHPPFTRFISIELSGGNAANLKQISHSINAWRQKIQMLYPEHFKNLKISPVLLPPLEVIKKKHRRLILISSPSVTSGRKILEAFLGAFKDNNLGISIKIDVDPIDFL